MQQATILIPDISGYTRFLTKTELSHSTHIINELLQVIADSIQHKFTLAEIEGDALLTYAKGKVSQKEIEEICQRAFINFHYYLKVIERDSVCRCGACQGASNLTLKFIVHYGTFEKIKIAQFTKLSGPDMVIAHRLLKNNVPNNEYILATDEYLEGEPGSTELDWVSSKQVYSMIGKVDYHYTLLNHLHDQIQSPELREDLSDLFGIAHSITLNIDAPIRLVHQVLTDNNEKINFVPELKRLELDSTINRIGSSHVCEFDGDSFNIQTVQEGGDDQDITYIEKATSLNTGFTMLAYYELKQQGETQTQLIYRGLSGDRQPLPEQVAEMVYAQASAGLGHLKSYVEGLHVQSRKAG